MRYLAKLNPNSGIYRDWKTRSRVSGIISGVLFRWDGGAYVADELPPSAIEPFLARQDKAVILETLGVLPEIEKQQVAENQEQQAKGSTPQQAVASELSNSQQVDEPARRAPRRPTRRRLAE